MVAGRYLNADNIGLGIKRQIKGVKKEIVDGRPQLVLYFFGDKRGLPLTRAMAEQLLRELGPHPMVEEFLRSGESLQ